MSTQQPPSTERVSWGIVLLGLWVSLGGALVVLGASGSSLVLLGLPVLLGGIFLVLLGSGVLPLRITSASTPVRDTVGRSIIIIFGVFSIAAGILRLVRVDRLNAPWQRIVWDVVLVLNGIWIIRVAREIKRRADGPAPGA
jgi:hypothetical protein